MPPAKVFVAHGRDLLAREAVGQVLQNLDLEPVVLEERVHVGQTWIEGLEAVSEDIAFAVVIYRLDDRGSLWSETQAPSPRVRQNVLFELGFMIAKLGRSKVCVLYEEGVEIPSDYLGAKFVKLDSEWDWKLHLTAALQDAGMNVDPARIIRRSPWSAPPDQRLIRDQVERTQQIVADLHALTSVPHRREVRFSGFLSAFALGDDEMSARGDGLLLSQERDGLLRLARAGCKISCIITMPAPVVNDPRVVSLRLSTLLAFLKSDDPALQHIYWAIAPRIESYVYVIGRISFLQGFKGDDTLRSFALTERRTSQEELHRQTTVFDERFNLHSAETLKRCELQRGGDLRKDLLRAAIHCVEASCESSLRWP